MSGRAVTPEKLAIHSTPVPNLLTLDEVLSPSYKGDPRVE